MKLLLNTLTAFALCIVITSCDRPECSNTNPVFDKFSPESQEYKAELAKQLALVDTSKLSYWMESFQEVEGAEYIHANVQGDDLCAVMVLSLRGSTVGIEGIPESKGKGFSGSELKDIEFDVVQDSGRTEFIFHSISGLID